MKRKVAESAKRKDLEEYTYMICN